MNNNNAKLRAARQERLASAIMERIHPHQTIAKPSFSPCRAACYHDHSGNPAGLSQCLDECRAEEAIAAVAERMTRELFDTFIEVVWAGGNIDPKPFERSVRESFSRPRD